MLSKEISWNNFFITSNYTVINPECIMGCFQTDTVFQSYKQIENSCVILISRNIWAINERNSCNNTAQLMKTREILFYICMYHVCMYVWGHLLMYIINTTNVNINVWQIISTVPRGEEIMGFNPAVSGWGGAHILCRVATQINHWGSILQSSSIQCLNISSLIVTAGREEGISIMSIHALL